MNNKKYEIISVLNELRNSVQTMREVGECDMRSVLWNIDETITEVMEILDREVK